MPFRSRLTTVRIDLTQPAHERWDEAVRGRRRQIRGILANALAASEQWRGGAVLRPFLARALSGLYALTGGLYRDEIKYFAEIGRVPARDVLWANCSYELLSLAERGGLGCTSAAVASLDSGPALVRCMDWDMDGALGAGSTWLEFDDDGREFVTLGVPGLIGALQGMVPGAWAACINYAPAGELPGFDFGPLFLLRHALETCDSYDEAVRLLRDTPLSAPAFFTVVGTEARQVCVIERRRREAAVRRPRNGVVTVANHHEVRRLRKYNELAADEDWSEERALTLRENVELLPGSASLKNVLACLRGEPVTNPATEQRVAFQPATGARAASVRSQ